MSDFAGHRSCEDHASRAGEAEGAILGLETARQLPPPHIAQLIEWQRRRVHAIGMQSKCDRACDAYVARYLGYHAVLAEKQRKALFAEAARIRRSVEKFRGRADSDDQRMRASDEADGGGWDCNETQHPDALSACLPIIGATIESRRAWDEIRGEAEKQMRIIARSLPVWPRCKDVHGFADLGLACLVAEAGNDLSAYPHHYHLWKRLGLAPYKGRAVSTFRRGELGKDEWIEAGYSPKRRGRIAGDIGVSLFLFKSRNAYGAVYAARRERTALTHPEWSKEHSDADGRRVMLKAFVADVWRWWREAEGAKLFEDTTTILPPLSFAQAALVAAVRGEFLNPARAEAAD